MYERIIELEKLTCTPQEFETYLNAIDLSEVEAQLLATTPNIYSFDELYNWNKITNPANGEVYYTVEVGGRVFIQNIVPFVSGNQPITSGNIQEVFAKHKKELTNSYITSEKIRLTIELFKNETI